MEFVGAIFASLALVAGTVITLLAVAQIMEFIRKRKEGK